MTILDKTKHELLNDIESLEAQLADLTRRLAASEESRERAERNMQIAAHDKIESYEQKLTELRQPMDCASAREWLDKKKVLTVVRRMESNGERYHLRLDDVNGDHLMDAEGAHWGWYEGTVDHRNRVADRLAELMTEYACAASQAEREALVGHLRWALSTGNFRHMDYWSKSFIDTPVLVKVCVGCEQRGEYDGMEPKHTPDCPYAAAQAALQPKGAHNG